MELRSRAALADDARVVEALVLVVEPRHHLARAPDPVRQFLGELVGDREQQRDERLLIRRVDRQTSRQMLSAADDSLSSR